MPESRIDTAYWRAVWEQAPKAGTRVPELFSYAQYDLFVLSTRVQPLVDKLAPGAMLTFNTRFVAPTLPPEEVVGDVPEETRELVRRNGKMSVDLLLYRGGVEWMPDSSILSRIEDEMWRVRGSDYPGHALLLRADTPIARDECYMPAHWVSSVLPCVALPAQYFPIFTGEGLLVIAGVGGKEEYDWLCNAVIDSLVRMFRAGVVALNEREVDFIRRWELDLYEGTQVDASESYPKPLSSVLPGNKYDNMRLYQPRWYDARITTTPSLFLLQRKTDNYYPVVVPGRGEVRTNANSYQELRDLLLRRDVPSLYSLVSSFLTVEPMTEVGVTNVREEKPPETPPAAPRRRVE